MSALTFTVVGIAKPQGSARAFIPKGWTRPVITTANQGMKPWRNLVASAASDAAQAAAWVVPAGAVQVVVDFYLPRPKSLGKRTPAHTKKPDLDKLARAVKDAISGVLYNDDAQVSALQARKFYTAPGEAPHAVIAVTPL
jgi:crossover junction endodeoxyribonuclease RusA